MTAIVLSFMLSLLPLTQDVPALQYAYQFYSNTTWNKIAPGRILERGVKDQRVIALRMRLILTKDLNEDYLFSDYYTAVELRDFRLMYDEHVETAVKNFQSRHGLEQDGKVGPITLAELNVTAEERAKQIKWNIDNNRAIEDERFVLVNIPEFTVRVIEQKQVVYTGKVIVGKTKRKHQTPVFSDFIETVRIGPDWTVPHSIGRDEFLPDLQKEGGADKLVRRTPGLYLLVNGTRQEIQDIDWTTFTYSKADHRFKQESGAHNALGHIKFNFPNPYGVYMHDTPSKRLFEKTTRTFSHGCIRVHNPEKLAAILLPRLEEEEIVEKMTSGKSQWLNLKTPVPVHIVYRTVWVEENGVHFAKDVYERMTWIQ